MLRKFQMEIKLLSLLFYPYVEIHMIVCEYFSFLRPSQPMEYGLLSRIDSNMFFFSRNDMRIFGFMETNQCLMNVMDYSQSQTTLE